MRSLQFALLTFSLFFVSCKRDNKSSPSNSVDLDALKAKKALYCDLSWANYQAKGYVGERCDSLLFTSLHAIACGEKFSVAEDEDPAQPGKWHRSPDRSCYPNDSKSESSKDMYRGLGMYMWKYKKKDDLKEVINYAESNGLRFCDAIDNETLVSRCIMAPSFLLLLKKMLGEISLTSDQQDSADATFVNTGFRAHLDVLAILHSGSVYGGITDGDLKTLKAQALRQPANALYQAAWAKYSGGNQERAYQVLMSPDYFPENKLPTNENYCTPYLFQHDFDGKNDEPCDEAREHDGTDFVFAATIIDGGF